jgi:hypothetical protein
MRQNKKWFQASLLSAISLLSIPVLVFAQSTSPNYRLEESYFGTGGEVDASSNNYRARQSTGSLGVDNTSSTNFDATPGDNVPSDPFLEAAVMVSSVDLGILSPDSPSYAAAQGGDCNCSFYVRSYMSSGYTVVTASPTMTSENGDTITAKSTQGAPSSDSSVEEFGINLVANLVPGTFGANPVNVPDNTFADGEAAPGYQTTGQYKYAQGDIIARSPATAGNQGVGQTNYTISYLAKIANLTEAGQYKINHDLIVVPTF